MFRTFTLLVVLSKIRVQYPVGLFAVIPQLHSVPVCCSGIFWMILRWFQMPLLFLVLLLFLNSTCTEILPPPPPPPLPPPPPPPHPPPPPLLLLLLLQAAAANYYYFCFYFSCHRPLLPGTSLEPAVIPSAQASSFTLQYFPYYVWCSKYSCLL